MKTKLIKILIPLNKAPFLHDLMTNQAKNICESLSLKCDLQIIWAIFPATGSDYFIDDKKNKEEENFHMIKSRDFNNTVDMIKSVNPDIIMINGSIDFHNIECNLVGRFLKIPTIVLFFRNRKTAISINTTAVLKTRIRGLSYKHKSDEGKDKNHWLISFYFNQYNYFFKTLRATNLGILKSIKNIFKHFQSIMFSYNPINSLIEGTQNFCVNEEWKIELENAKFNKNSITVTGDPFFEYISNENLMRKKNLNNEKTKIIFCTSVLANHSFCSKNKEMQFIIDVCNEVLKNGENELVIKIHPSTEDLYDYEEMVLPKLSKKINIFQTENLLDLIQENDLVLSYSGSGAIRDGVFSKKPVINLKFGIAKKWFQDVYVDDKLIIQCNKIEELEKYVKENKNKIFEKDDFEKFIQKYVGHNAGKSSEICSKKIMELIKS